MTESYELTIGNHPAQAAHPFTRKLLVDENGDPVPLFPKEKSIRLDGRVIAFVNEGLDINFIVPLSKLGVIADEAKALVKSELGGIGQSNAIADRTIPIDVDDDETEPEEQEDE